MTINMNTPTKFEKEVRRTLDILIKNFRMQAPENIKTKEVALGIHLDEVNDNDPENIYPKVFCDTVRTLKRYGINIDEYDQDVVLSDSTNYGDEYTSFCKVTVPSDFETIYKKLIGTSNSETEKKRLIEKDARGEYFYDGKPIQLQKNTIYSKIFEALCSRSDQDGYLSYEDIEKFLVNSGEEKIITVKEKNKRIRNAVNDSQGLFRFAKVNGKRLENKILNGNLLIETRRGKGLRLNNPLI